MDCIDPVTKGILSLHVLPVENLREMLSHTEEMLLSTMHLPISSEDALHFYRYLCTHILIADEQFLLLIKVPIQDHTQQMEIYEVFNLDVPHRNFSACYSIHNRYLGIMHDETKAVEISEDQFKKCQKVNGQFFNLNTPLLPLTNLCISLMCQGQGQHAEKMFTTDQESQQYKHTNIYSSKCLNDNFPNHSITIRNHTHLPWRNIQICHTTDTHSCTSTTTSMQHNITAFSSTTMLQIL